MVELCLPYGKKLASRGIFYAAKVRKSIGCGISHKIQNIHVSAIESIVYLNVPLNYDMYNRQRIGFFFRYG